MWVVWMRYWQNGLYFRARAHTHAHTTEKATDKSILIFTKQCVRQLFFITDWCSLPWFKSCKVQQDIVAAKFTFFTQVGAAYIYIYKLLATAPLDREITVFNAQSTMTVISKLRQQPATTLYKYKSLSYATIWRSTHWTHSNETWCEGSTGHEGRSRLQYG